MHVFNEIIILIFTMQVLMGVFLGKDMGKIENNLIDFIIFILLPYKGNDLETTGW